MVRGLDTPEARIRAANACPGSARVRRVTSAILVLLLLPGLLLPHGCRFFVTLHEHHGEGEHAHFAHTPVVHDTSPFDADAVMGEGDMDEDTESSRDPIHVQLRLGVNEHDSDRMQGTPCRQTIEDSLDRVGARWPILPTMFAISAPAARQADGLSRCPLPGSSAHVRVPLLI